MRAVLDTNVVVSALIWGGKPFALLETAADGGLTLYSSNELIAELRSVLGRLHLTRRLERRRSSPERAVALYAELATLVAPLKLAIPVSRDPDDDAVLATALAANADLIVSGDGDLLVLGEYSGIPIVTPAQAVVLLGA